MSDERSTTPLSGDSVSENMHARNGSFSPVMRTSLTAHRRRRDKNTTTMSTPSPASSEFNWDLEVKQFYKNKAGGESGGGGNGSGGLRKRGVRCMNCSACQRVDDCGKCVMCKDKKKFGGPGVKKQACM